MSSPSNLHRKALRNYFWVERAVVVAIGMTALMLAGFASFYSFNKAVVRATGYNLLNLPVFSVSLIGIATLVLLLFGIDIKDRMLVLPIIVKEAVFTIVFTFGSVLCVLGVFPRDSMRILDEPVTRNMILGVSLSFVCFAVTSLAATWSFCKCFSALKGISVPWRTISKLNLFVNRDLWMERAKTAVIFSTAHSALASIFFAVILPLSFGRRVPDLDASTIYIFSLEILLVILFFHGVENRNCWPILPILVYKGVFDVASPFLELVEYAFFPDLTDSSSPSSSEYTEVSRVYYFAYSIVHVMEIYLIPLDAAVTWCIYKCFSTIRSANKKKESIASTLPPPPAYQELVQPTTASQCHSFTSLQV